VRDPKEAPSSSEKCWPRVGVRGEVIVKPRRFRDVERRIAVMAMFRFLVIWMFFSAAAVVVDNDGDDDVVDDELLLFSLEGVEDAILFSLNDDDDDNTLS